MYLFFPKFPSHPGCHVTLSRVPLKAWSLNHWTTRDVPVLTVFNDSCVSVQSLNCVQLFATPWTAACQASLSITNSRSLLKLMSIESVMPSNHLILCPPLLLLPSIFPSIRVFSNESVLPIRWPKYWSFSFSISPSNEYSGLISFRMDWLDLLAVQETLKSLLQHHSSKTSVRELCLRLLYSCIFSIVFFLGGALYFSWLDVALCSRSFWRSLPRCSGVMLTICCMKALPAIHGQLGLQHLLQHLFCVDDLFL